MLYYNVRSPRKTQPPLDGRRLAHGVIASALTHTGVAATLLLLGLTAAPPEPPENTAIEVALVADAPSEIVPPPQTAPPQAPAPKPPAPEPPAAPPAAPPEPQPPPAIVEPAPPPPHPQAAPSPVPVRLPNPPPPPRPRPKPAPDTAPTSPPAPPPALVATAPARADPPAPSAPAPTPRARPDAAWQRLIADWLRTHRAYPPEARANGEEGAVVVRFTLDHDGTVLEVTIIHSSGHRALDEATLAMLRGARLPQATDAGDPAHVTVDVQVQYRLDR